MITVVGGRLKCVSVDRVLLGLECRVRLFYFFGLRKFQVYPGVFRESALAMYGMVLLP